MLYMDSTLKTLMTLKTLKTFPLITLKRSDLITSNLKTFLLYDHLVPL